MNVDKLRDALFAQVKAAADEFVAGAIRQIIDRVENAPLLGKSTKKNGKAAAPEVTKPRTKQPTAVMRCRHPGCKARSKGPRFHYLCDEHIDVKAEVKRQLSQD